MLKALNQVNSRLPVTIITGFTSAPLYKLSNRATKIIDTISQ
jgi:hypothetical protein